MLHFGVGGGGERGGRGIRGVNIQSHSIIYLYIAAGLHQNYPGSHSRGHRSISYVYISDFYISILSQSSCDTVEL